MLRISRSRAAKRILDLVVATIVTAMTLPVFLVIALLVRVTMGAPVLFRQQRTGLHGRLFTLHKFRTMRDTRDVDGFLAPDGERITRLGRMLRATSLDELPTFIDVLRGELSLVGPRPLLPEYLDRYSPAQARRHDVKPGITGLSQVAGRNSITWDEKFDLDVWYVDHGTLLCDLKILALTTVHVIRRTGISQPGHATMPEFLGLGDAAADRADPALPTEGKLG